MKGMIPAGGGGSRGAKGTKMAANEQKLVFQTAITCNEMILVRQGWKTMNHAGLLLLFYLNTPESKIIKVTFIN